MGPSILGAGLSAVTSIMKGNAQAAGDQFSASQEQEQYAEGMVRSYQTATALQQHPTNTLSQLEAVRGSTGVDPNSPSGNSIENRIFGLSNQDIQRDVSNIQQDAQMHFQAAQFYRQSAFDAQTAGGIGAIGGLLQAGLSAGGDLGKLRIS
jgi:hypothetical protein